MDPEHLLLERFGKFPKCGVSVGFFRCYLGIMEKKMETTGLYLITLNLQVVVVDKRSVST